MTTANNTHLHLRESALDNIVGPKCAKIKTKEKLVSANLKDDNLNWVSCVEKIRDKQDKDAFALLFREYAPRVKGFLLKAGMSNSSAEECVQDTMAIVWHKAHLFDASRASVATWLFTIARNKRVDLLRKQNRPEPEELLWGPEAEPDAEDVVNLTQETKKLSLALTKLPEKQRDLIKRAFFGDLTHQEIVEQTGLPLGTIKSRIRLALEKLRHEMK